jgi:hypothetical protein
MARRLPRALRRVARGRRPPQEASYFLAGDPHVPLAVVTAGRISDSAFDSGCGDAKRWKAIGSRWRALDAWGQPLGIYTASAKDDYDVTGCAELSFEPALDLSHVLVSIDSAWKAPASAAWAAPRARRMDLAALVKTTLDDAKLPADQVWSQCASIAEHERFFATPDGGHWVIATSNVG